MAEREQVLRCPSGHECPTLPRIFRALRLREVDVLNVYIVGSHMWGSCTGKSDWDFVIVAKQLDSNKPINAHKGFIEAFILSKEQFIHFLRIIPFKCFKPSGYQGNLFCWKCLMVKLSSRWIEQL